MWLSFLFCSLRGTRSRCQKANGILPLGALFAINVWLDQTENYFSSLGKIPQAECATLQPPSLWEACQRLQNSRRSINLIRKKTPYGVFFYLLLHYCNNLYLNEDAFGKCFYRYAGASRLLGEVSCINLIESGKISHICKEAGCLYCALK